MNPIEFMFVLLNKWHDKVAYGSTDDVKKVYSDYSDYCLVNGLSPQKEENLIDFIEKCKYEELPLATRHDIYRAAQVQLLSELSFLREDSGFVREFIEVLRSGVSDVNRIEGILDVINNYLDRYEDDKSIDDKLTKHQIKWDSSVG